MKRLRGSSWFMTQGACVDADPADFMEEPVTRLRRLDNPRFVRAIGTCAGCLVRETCFEWATNNHETGIWAGKYLISGHEHPLR